MRYQYWRDRDNQKDLPIVFKLDDWKPNDSYYLHWHRSVEILLINYGSVEIHNGGHTVTAKAGEMHIIHSTHPHSFQIGAEQTQYFCLLIHENLFPVKSFFANPLPYMTEDEECIALYRKAWEVYNAKAEFYEQATLGLLLQLYARLASLGGKQTVEGAQKINKTVYHAARYIEHNFQQKLCIDDIAASVGVSRHHLCHVFKEVMGTTLTAYWQEVRCNAARQMLRNGASVSETAEACGFVYGPYFARVYHKHFGISPGKDKQSQNET